MEGWIQSIGHYLINEVSISIGGQIIDRHYGQWMEVWQELTLDGEKDQGYGNMIGKDLPFYDVTEPVLVDKKTVDRKLRIPLQFWFCRNPGLALPLISLQYHEIALKFKLNTLEQLVFARNETDYITSNTTLTNILLPQLRLWVDYYFLDTTERRKFAQNAHEYLIEQVQVPIRKGVLSGSDVQTLNMGETFHPVKEIMWLWQRTSSTPGIHIPPNDWSMGGGDALPQGNPQSDAPLNWAEIQFNKTPRFEQRDGEYFRTCQPYEYHTKNSY